jgi:hypothetical protein
VLLSVKVEDDTGTSHNVWMDRGGMNAYEIRVWPLNRAGR